MKLSFVAMTFYFILMMATFSSEWNATHLLLIIILIFCSKVEEYSDSIRRSSEVQFAISVVQCVDSNNFVRFFKLVKLG